MLKQLCTPVGADLRVCPIKVTGTDANSNTNPRDKSNEQRGVVTQIEGTHTGVPQQVENF